MRRRGGNRSEEGREEEGSKRRGWEGMVEE